MCGLAAIVGIDGYSPSIQDIQAMTSTLVHRGPDDAGQFIEKNVALGFRRLAILDLAPTGHQPMIDNSGQFIIIFNGEIFNYVELRKELQQRGYVFCSSGDTEVLLAAYREWGAECLHRLNGMWAFLILNRKTGVIFGARDRFGVKPLYRYQGQRYLLFGSEIKAIRDSGLASLSVDWSMVARFLLEGRLDDSLRTLYSEVDQVPPGFAFTVDAGGTYCQWQYWSLDVEATDQTADAFERFATLFEDAVKIRMRSDVPVGVLLSGGLDSTSIICSMARTRKAGIEVKSMPHLAFCYSAPEYDEEPFIEATVAQTGVQIERLSVNPAGMWEDIERHLYHQDEPVHSATSLIGYRLMELAREHGVKVLLNGQGADETLAGYPSYFTDHWVSMIRAGHLGAAYREMQQREGLDKITAAAKLATCIRATIQGELRRSRVYRHLSAHHNCKIRSQHSWYHRRILENLEPAEESYEPRGLSRALEQSVKVSPLPLYLRVEDRNSMAHSVEVRLPFLDYRLVSLAFQLPSEFKLCSPWNKWLLRKGMEGRIPECVRQRPEKFGFPTSVDKWFRTAWYEPMRGLLHDPLLKNLEILNIEAIRQDLEAHRMGNKSAGAALFDIAQLAMWLQLCHRSGVIL